MSDPMGDWDGELVDVMLEKSRGKDIEEKREALEYWIEATSTGNTVPEAVKIMAGSELPILAKDFPERIQQIYDAGCDLSEDEMSEEVRMTGYRCMVLVAAQDSNFSGQVADVLLQVFRDTLTYKTSNKEIDYLHGSLRSVLRSSPGSALQSFFYMIESGNSEQQKFLWEFLRDKAWEDLQDLWKKERWNGVQGEFVEELYHAVETADPQCRSICLEILSRLPLCTGPTATPSSLTRFAQLVSLEAESTVSNSASLESYLSLLHPVYNRSLAKGTPPGADPRWILWLFCKNPEIVHLWGIKLAEEATENAAGPSRLMDWTAHGFQRMKNEQRDPELARDVPDYFSMRELGWDLCKKSFKFAMTLLPRYLTIDTLSERMELVELYLLISYFMWLKFRGNVPELMDQEGHDLEKLSTIGRLAEAGAGRAEKGGPQQAKMWSNVMLLCRNMSKNGATAAEYMQTIYPSWKPVSTSRQTAADGSIPTAAANSPATPISASVSTREPEQSPPHPRQSRDNAMDVDDDSAMMASTSTSTSSSKSTLAPRSTKAPPTGPKSTASIPTGPRIKSDRTEIRTPTVPTGPRADIKKSSPSSSSGHGRSPAGTSSSRALEGDSKFSSSNLAAALAGSSRLPPAPSPNQITAEASSSNSSLPSPSFSVLGAAKRQDSDSLIPSQSSQTSGFTIKGEGSNSNAANNNTNNNYNNNSTNGKRKRTADDSAADEFGSIRGKGEEANDAEEDEARMSKKGKLKLAERIGGGFGISSASTSRSTTIPATAAGGSSSGKKTLLQRIGKNGNGNGNGSTSSSGPSLSALIVPASSETPSGSSAAHAASININGRATATAGSSAPTGHADRVGRPKLWDRINNAGPIAATANEPVVGASGGGIEAGEMDIDESTNAGMGTGTGAGAQGSMGLRISGQGQGQAQGQAAPVNPNNGNANGSSWVTRTSSISLSNDPNPTLVPPPSQPPHQPFRPASQPYHQNRQYQQQRSFGVGRGGVPPRGPGGIQQHQQQQQQRIQQPTQQTIPVPIPASGSGQPKAPESAPNDGMKRKGRGFQNVAGG